MLHSSCSSVSLQAADAPVWFPLLAAELVAKQGLPQDLWHRQVNHS
jgi:hypothetical protein